MNSLIQTSSMTKNWLEAANPQSQESQSMKRLGIWLCEQIASRDGRCISVGNGKVELPLMSQFVALHRSELLNVVTKLTVHSGQREPLTTGDRNEWKRLLGAMAVSHAKSGDVVVVAALLRLAARLDLQGKWLSEAKRYLLTQQHSDGSFGMLAAEMEFVGRTKRVNELATLRLTVEVLWALAELAALEKRSS